MLLINRLRTSLAFVLLCGAWTSAYSYSLQGDAGIGYRHDNLHWSLNGGAQGPNVLSEMKWKDLRMINYFGQLRLYAPFISYVRLTGNYGTIFNGACTDIDYRGDNRSNPFSYALCDASKGEAFELSAAIGQVFDWIPYLTIIPLVGYSVQEQHLRFYNGALNNIPMPELASNYRAKWYTPYLGADFVFKPTGRLKIIGTGEWHWGWYRGTGYWNLRTDFLSEIRHKATGSGVLFRLQGIYSIWSSLTCGITGEYTAMETRPGVHQVDVNEPLLNSIGEFVQDQAVVSSGVLNEVDWYSWRIMITSGFDF